MSGHSEVHPPVRVCPFCGVATAVAHESQESCIAALHAEIGRMRGILSTLTPTGVRDVVTLEDDERARALRIGLSNREVR